MGYLYILQAGKEDFYKIGVSREFPENKRLGSLQTGNHLLLTVLLHWESEAYVVAEKLLHYSLLPYKTVGEWFNVPLENIIEKLNAVKILLKDIEFVYKFPDLPTLVTVDAPLGDYHCKYCGVSKKSQTAVYGHYRHCNMKTIHDSSELYGFCNCLHCTSK
jgi:Meiotically Up-regulated Gene 113 (MUG113) protein